MKKSVFVLLPALLLSCLVATTNAAEEQIVIDDLSPAQLRAEIAKVQNEFYRVFNAANSDDKLDIICHTYTRTGTRISDEACEPQFVIDRRGENAADTQRDIDELLSPEALQAELESEFQILTDAMNALAKENQYFRELNTILGVLRERLEEITN